MTTQATTGRTRIVPPGSLTRRKFLLAGTGTGAGLLLGGCSGGSGESAGELTFQAWTNPPLEKAYRDIGKRYEKQNPGSKIRFVPTPFEQYYQKLDTSLAAGEAWDVARIQYQHMGNYAAHGAAMDLSESLPSTYGAAFVPSLWQAVQSEGSPYGVPLGSGTQAIYYNKKIFDHLGIKAPQSPDEAWTWDEFLGVADQIKKSGEAKYPFALNWQGESNAYRWMMFLYQHGGSLLNGDLSGPNVNNSVGIETIEFTQSWFTQGLVPPGTSIKSGTAIENLFVNGTIAMMIDGAYKMLFLKEHMDEESWGVTYLIRDVQVANCLGGNAGLVTKDSGNPEQAADFLKFLSEEENMRRYVVAGHLLPARRSLVGRSAKELGFEYRPEDTGVYLEETPNVPQRLAAEQTLPEFNAINLVLAAELEAAFKSGQSAEATAANIDSGIVNELSG